MTQLNDVYEIVYHNGYYLLQEVIVSKSGKVRKTTKTYANVNSLVTGLVEHAIDYSADIECVCEEARLEAGIAAAKLRRENKKSLNKNKEK